MSPIVVGVKKEKVLLYSLPDSREDVIFALCALANCAKVRNEYSFEVVFSHEWQRKMNSVTFMLPEGKGNNPRRLELPVNLNGKSPVEWYCRSAGFIIQWESVSKKMMEEAGRVLDGN